MTARQDISWRVVAKVILVVVAIGAGLYFFYLVREVLTLFLVSVFLAVALAPPVNAIHRGRMPRAGAILLVYLGLVLSIVGIGLLVVPPIVNGVNNLTKNLPTYVEDLRKNDTIRRYDEKYHIVNSLQKEANKAPQRIGDAAGTLRDVTVGVFTRIVQLVTVLVMTFLLLRDGRRFMEFVYRQLPPEREPRARKLSGDVERAISGYVIGNLLISVVAGLVTFVTLTLLDVPFAVPLAVLMAFLDLIPLVGATIGGVIIGIVCAIVDFPTAVIVWVIVLLVYQQVENNLLQPIIYSRTVQLHPLFVLIGVLIGATLLGVLGVLLAIPAAAVVQLLLKDWWAHRPGAEGRAPAVGAEQPTG